MFIILYYKYFIHNGGVHITKVYTLYIHSKHTAKVIINGVSKFKDF